MEFYVIRHNEKNTFCISNDIEDAIIKMFRKDDNILYISEMRHGRYGVRLLKNGKKINEYLFCIGYNEYVEKYPKELSKNTSLINRKHAWMYFWPDGRGKSKDGYVLHHKDTTLKTRKKTRYRKWLPEDLVMITMSEHMKLHASGRKCSDKVKRINRKRMLGNKNNTGKCWYNNGEKNVRALECPEGYVHGQLRKWRTQC